jgi:ABC-2 type transport system permease protein
MNWGRVLGVIEKYFLESRRDIFRVFDIVWWPTFQLIVWGLFSVYLQKVSANSLNLVSILLGAVMLWTIFDRASRDISIIITNEMWNKNLINILSSPLRLSEYLFSIVCIAIIKLVISVVFMILLASVLYAFSISSIGWYFIPATVGLAVFGWSISLCAQASLFRFGRSLEVFIWATAALIQPFSCVFYPLTALPPWAKTIATFLPTTYYFESMRGVMNGNKVDTTSLAIAYGLTLVYFLLSLRLFYVSIHQAKKSGALVKQY